MSVMLYKHPGKHKLHGDMFDYIIVNEDRIADTINEGWTLTTNEALKANSKKDTKKVSVDNSKPTREEMEIQAKKLEIRFPANIKDSTLLSKIDEKLDELD